MAEPYMIFSKLIINHSIQNFSGYESGIGQSGNQAKNIFEIRGFGNIGFINGRFECARPGHEAKYPGNFKKICTH